MWLLVIALWIAATLLICGAMWLEDKASNAMVGLVVFGTALTAIVAGGYMAVRLLISH